MGICQNCGKQLDDGLNFCDTCGAAQLKAAFCPQCGELLKDGADVCAKCGAKVSGVVSASQKPGGKSKVILGAAAAVLLAAAAAAAVYFLVIAKKPDIPLSMYYIKNNNLMHTDFKGKEPVCVGENAYENEARSDDSGINEVSDYYFKTSKDGKKAAYAFSMEYRGNTDEEEGYALHFTDNEKPEIIVDSSVLEHYISDGGEVITYIKIGNNGCELWQYNTVTAEKMQLDVGVVSGYREDYTMLKMSPDKLTALYVNGRSQLCLKKYGESKRKLADNVPENYFFGLNDFTEFVYLKDNDLCKMTADGKEKIIAADVQSVENVCDTGEIYFTRYEREKVPLAEFLDDDMAGDKYIAEPVIPDSPVRSDYNSRSAYERAVDQYLYSANYANMEAEEYIFKQQRDEIRKKSKSDYVERDNYILYFYDGSAEIKVAEHVDIINRSGIKTFAKPIIAYTSQKVSDEQKKVKMSEISSQQSLGVPIYGIFSDTVHDLASGWYAYEKYIAAGANVQRLERCDEIERMTADNTCDNIYYYGTQADIRYMYKVTFSGGKPQKPVEYDGALSLQGLLFLPDNRVVYLKEWGEKYVPVLCVDKKEIEKNVIYYDTESNIHSFQYIESTGAFFYLAEKNSGSVMKMYDNGTITEIADNVNDIRKLPDDTIAYLDNTGNLYRYSRGKSKLVDSDIYALVK